MIIVLNMAKQQKPYRYQSAGSSFLISTVDANEDWHTITDVRNKRSYGKIYCIIMTRSLCLGLLQTTTLLQNI